MENDSRQPLVVLTGPTAVGKTALSVLLAKTIGGEIISADSMQVYRHMDIGSAKVTEEEKDGVPHYLIDVLDPTEEFNIMRFQSMAKDAVKTILQKGRIPILTGGTGFYIQSVIRDVAFTKEPSDTSYRDMLQKRARTEGETALHEMLERIDPASAGAIPPGNVKRVIRALEYYHLTGEKISVHNQRERQKQSPYNYVYFVLNDKRERLYAAIDSRVDAMMEQGLVKEVKRLKDMGCTRGMTSMAGLGYKEILDYLDGVCTLEEAVYRIKRDTRHFAKRQLTWFRREQQVIWLDKESFAYDDAAILKRMTDILKDRHII